MEILWNLDPKSRVFAPKSRVFALLGAKALDFGAKALDFFDFLAKHLVNISSWIGFKLDRSRPTWGKQKTTLGKATATSPREVLGDVLDSIDP